MCNLFPRPPPQKKGGELHDDKTSKLIYTYLKFTKTLSVSKETEKKLNDQIYSVDRSCSHM